MKTLKEHSKQFQDICSSLIIGAIQLYQKTLSPDHGPFQSSAFSFHCRYYPSCSQYAIQSISQYGLLKGTIASCKRIFRCNPLFPGGYDPVKKDTASFFSHT